MTDNDNSKETALDILRKARATLREAKEMTIEATIPLDKDKRVEIDDTITVEITKQVESKIEREIQAEIKAEIQIHKQVSKVPFEKSKFGKIVKALEIAHGIDDWEATKRARGLLKLPRKSLRELEKIDREILVYYETP